MSIHSAWQKNSPNMEHSTLLPRLPRTANKVERREMAFSIETKLWTQINHWLEEKNGSSTTLLLSVWAVLLWRYNDTDQLCFWVKLNEKHPLPIRLQINPNDSFNDVLEQVQQQLRTNRDVQVDFEHPIDHLLQISKKDDQVQTYTMDTPFHIHFRWGSGVDVEIQYSTGSFSSYFVKQLSTHLKNILNHMILLPDGILKTIHILSPVEQDQIVHRFNQTKIDFPLEKTVDQLLVEQSIKTPQKAAIVDQNDVCTYQELHEKSNQLAHYLQKQGVKRGQIVGLLVDDSPWLMIGMFGILKAGAAFLPIDPHYPSKRINYIIQDSNLSALITLSTLTTPFAYQGPIIQLDQVALGEESTTTPIRLHRLEDPVYVIYTSGSTGYPKGVVVEHRALLNLVHWHNHVYQITAEDVSTKYAGIGFDASVWEVFPYLVAGATIHIIPAAIRFDVDALHRYYQQHQVTVSFLPTPVAEQFMKQDNPSLRLLLTGGDQLRQVEKQSYQIVNNYGPTENTVVTTSGFVDGQEQLVTIGKPIANNQVYILNRFNQLQPIGIPGELCISGDSLARGYLNRNELTNKKFVEHPLFPGKRMYRTGDLARWLPDGRIEFLGRMDQQVKIRGFRIELGEIETTLMRHHQVKEAAVTVEMHQQQSEPVLCAYIVSHDSNCSISELKSFLQDELPPYMVPSYWMVMDQIPLTQHGKVDKKALPKLTSNQTATSLKIEQMHTLERKLYRIWKNVLGVPPVHQQDHFFHAGGHSIKAMQLIARIRHEVGVEITWNDLFTHPTFQELSKFVQQAQTIQHDSIEPVTNPGPYPVSPVQQQLFALEQMRELGTTYHTPIVWLIRGKLDLDRLQYTLQCLIDRHEALRTSFQLMDGELKQQVHNQVNWRMEVFEAQDEDEAKRQVANFIRPFDLHQSPLFRIGLIRLSANKTVLIMDVHHLIFDGVSMGILHREFEQLYLGKKLPSISYQYKDYAIWMQKQLATKQLQQDEQYWLAQFREEIPRLQLPTDFHRPAQQRFRGKRIRVTLSDELIKQCKDLSRKQNTTLYMTLLSVYSLLLTKMSDQESFIIGSMVAGRSRPEWERVMGMFVNSLPIHITPKKAYTFEQLLMEVKKKVLAAQEHSHYPFIKLVEKLGIKWDHSRNPLFDTVFVMQNMELPRIDIPGLEIEPFPYEEKHAMFDLTWEITEQETFELSVEYNTDLFRQHTIERMVRHYLHLLRQVIVNPQKKIADFVLITEDEKELILTKFNQPQFSEINGQSVLELFTNQAQEMPEKIAIVSGDQTITYRQLEQESNQLARLLRRKGIRDEKIVAVLADASIEFIIGLFAILKAGGAFLPIDPAYPPRRIQYLLEDSGAALVLLQKGIQLPKNQLVESLYLDRRIWAQEASHPFNALINQQQLAYVIYTSGSTGKPKGVMVEHKSLLNLVLWHHENYQITAEDRSTKYAGVGFDASVWEIFPYLTKGATIYLVEPDKRYDIVALNQFFEENRITISFLPTAIAESFMELENTSLRLLLVGGDKLKRIRPTRYTIVNNYGPTENTVVTTCYALDHHHEQQVIPIGRPIRNQQVYILNREMQLQPIGVPGELCISGDGLARGYLHRPQLTKEKFCPNPFDPKKRMYRTGDLARWLPDGNIEYLGRMDDQVQIRGYRIELGEIESVLLEHPNVQEAVVLAQQFDDQSEMSLCAYIVGDRVGLKAELQDYLKKSLPDYMIPTYLIQLDAFPLTANGKLDRKAFPRPGRDDLLDTEYQPPTNPTEQLLVKIWQEVLKQKEIGITDHFFSLGGDSIKAIQVAARLQQHGKKIDVHQILQYPTIQTLAMRVEDQRLPSSQQPLTGKVPLTPIQRHFFAQSFANKHHWNQAVLIASPSPWEIEGVKRSFQQLVSYHDVLRMRYFETEKGQIEQRMEEVSTIHFTVDTFHYDRETDLAKKIREEADRLQRSLNLEHGPLVRLAIFETDDRHELLIIVHHLLIDGVSWRILLDDFFHLYQGYLQQKKRSLPPKTTSYQLWAQKLLAYANSSEFLQEVAYWEEMDKKTIPPLFRSDTILPKGRLKDSATLQFCLNKEQTTALLEEVHHAYHTEINDLLLAGLCLAVREWSQVHRMALNLEGHGREGIFDGVDLTRTIGWFTTIYPVVFELSSSLIPDMIKSVKETLRAVPNKGLGYGVLRYLTKPKNRKNLRFSVQPEISFNYLGQFSEEIRFAGIGSGTAQMGDCFSPTSLIHPLEIYGAVLDDRLQFRFLFLQTACQRAQMQRLADLYQHFLIQIIQHCKGKTEPTWTPSDFSASNLSSEELDQFLQNLD